MTKAKKIVTIIILIALLLCVPSVLFAERVVSSQTLVITAYIPPRTNVAFDSAGKLLFTSNSTNVILSVVETGSATLLNVIAR
jgi:hypothetical protein